MAVLAASKLITNSVCCSCSCGGYCRGCGKILRITMNQSENGLFTGTSLVEFSDAESAARARQMGGRVLLGCAITVAEKRGPTAMSMALRPPPPLHHLPAGRGRPL